MIIQRDLLIFGLCIPQFAFCTCFLGFYSTLVRFLWEKPPEGRYGETLTTFLACWCLWQGGMVGKRKTGLTRKPYITGKLAPSDLRAIFSNFNEFSDYGMMNNECHESFFSLITMAFIREWNYKQQPRFMGKTQLKNWNARQTHPRLCLFFKEGLI